MTAQHRIGPDRTGQPWRTPGRLPARRPRFRTLLLGSVAGLLAQPALAAGPAPGALPTGGTVAAGQANISQSGSRMDVTQDSQKAIINWQSFNIGNQAEVDFHQPNAAATALNRVLSADPSTILGKLTANGQIILINPNGVVFGSGARVDVGGLVASVLDVKDSDFLAGNLAFERGDADGRIVNKGHLSAASGGYIALLAPEVRNDGVIEARFGTVALAAGDAVTLDLSGTGRLTLKVDPATVKAEIDNRGLIIATDGQALLSAQAVNKLLGGTINLGGVVEAGSLTGKGGDIVLNGSGEVTLAGLTDVAGKEGGGTVTATGQDVTLTAGGHIRASGSGNGNGGSVTLLAGGATTVDGTIEARGGPKGGDGGWVLTSGNRLTVGSAFIDTRAPSGATGTWLLNAASLTVAANGGTIRGATLSANLGRNNVTLLSSSGDVTVDAPISWSTATFLQLSSFHDVDIAAPITNSGGAPMILRADNTGTGSGTVHFTGGGTVSTAGPVSIFYNPTSFATPTDFSPFVLGGAALTAYMLVNDLDHLQAINTNLAGNYALGRNIDAAATSGWNGGAGFVPLGSLETPFSGIFDGQDHTISALTIDRPTQNDVGLFGRNTGTVRNVNLIDAQVSGAQSVGSLAGTNLGTISNSSAGGTVSGSSAVGGLVGDQAFPGTITNSYATGAVIGGQGVNSVGGLVGYNGGSIEHSFATGAVRAGDGSSSVGGLVGSNESGMIAADYATGAVTAGNMASDVGGLVGSQSMAGIDGSHATGSVQVGTGSRNIGGLVGSLTQAAISNSNASGAVFAGTGATNVGGLVGIVGRASIASSFAAGSVTVGSAARSIGGLVGQNGGDGDIATSFATGAVTAGAQSTAIGGLVGENLGQIDNSYATGSVTAGPNSSSIGGLVGDNTIGMPGFIINSYSTGRVEAGPGSTGVGGLVGTNTGFVTNSYWNLDSSGQAGSAAGTGLTTAQMLVQANFVGWDFTTVWTLPPGSFPKLRGVGGQ